LHTVLLAFLPLLAFVGHSFLFIHSFVPVQSLAFRFSPLLQFSLHCSSGLWVLRSLHPILALNLYFTSALLKYTCAFKCPYLYVRFYTVLLGLIDVRGCVVYLGVLLIYCGHLGGFYFMQWAIVLWGVLVI
jgi:hypothetical protein